MQQSHLFSSNYDLVSPDGKISSIGQRSITQLKATILIQHISPLFIGYKIDPINLLFNIKSTLAQLGVDAKMENISFDKKRQTAEILLNIQALGSLAELLLSLMEEGVYIGKLFARDERRLVRNHEDLLRLFGQTDHKGHPLLFLGKESDTSSLELKTIEGRAVANLALLDGTTTYDSDTLPFLRTLIRALKMPHFPVRPLLQLHQQWKTGKPRIVQKNEILLVKTRPLHIRTLFARVVPELLPKGYFHTAASILEPSTRASGDIYECFGESDIPINSVPLEFYSLEPYRRSISFTARDQLKHALANPQNLFQAFATTPKNPRLRTSTWISTPEELFALNENSWISRETHPLEFPGLIHPGQQAQAVDAYIEQQPAYSILKSIETGTVSSEGILLNRYFPSPLMKKLLLGDRVLRYLKAIYFHKPSLSQDDFFSHEDRTTLLDLAKFGIPVFWVDQTSGNLLQYVANPKKDSGMFVPLDRIQTFLNATFFGIYGSNINSSPFSSEITKLLRGIETLKQKTDHPLLNPQTPLAFVTGGGPGVMEIGNQIAKNLNILSCANIVDFRGSSHEQKPNPYIEAKMTYRLDRLLERQVEFNLDFPLITYGGIGTDFECSLETLRRKIGQAPTPVLLLGNPEYWKNKLTASFQENLKMGTITGFEWISNCFYCIETADQALKIYSKFFSNTLSIGPKHSNYQDGFLVVK